MKFQGKKSVYNMPVWNQKGFRMALDANGESNTMFTDLVALPEEGDHVIMPKDLFGIYKVPQYTWDIYSDRGDWPPIDKINQDHTYAVVEYDIRTQDDQLSTLEVKNGVVYSWEPSSSPDRTQGEYLIQGDLYPPMFIAARIIRRDDDGEVMALEAVSKKLYAHVDDAYAEIKHMHVANNFYLSYGEVDGKQIQLEDSRKDVLDKKVSQIIAGHNHVNVTYDLLVLDGKCYGPDGLYVSRYLCDYNEDMFKEKKEKK
jgi:hypothetical protein